MPTAAHLFVRRAGSQDADDLVQETFTRFAIVGAERKVLSIAPERYLTRIGSNLLRDKVKSASARRASRFRRKMPSYRHRTSSKR